MYKEYQSLSLSLPLQMDGSNCHRSSILVKHLIIISYEFQNIIIVVSKLEKCFRLLFLFDNEIKGQMGHRIFYHSIPKNILKQTWEIKSKEYRGWFNMIHEEIINKQKFIVVDTTNKEDYCTYTFILVHTTNVKTQNWRLCII